MKRRTFLGVIALAVCSVWADEDEGFVLVTPEQFEAEQRAQAAQMPLPPASRKRGLFPLIRIVAPQAGATGLCSPLRFDIRFETSLDAHIVPATFRVLYGILKFDLTDTLKSHAHWTQEGIVVPRAMVPPGTHRLLVQIADDHGRVNEQELRLTVAG